jgi:hypothetical protein
MRSANVHYPDLSCMCLCATVSCIRIYNYSIGQWTLLFSTTSLQPYVLATLIFLRVYGPFVLLNCHFVIRRLRIGTVITNLTP